MRTYTFRAKPKDLLHGQFVEGSLIDMRPINGPLGGVFIYTEQGEIEVRPETIVRLLSEPRWERVLAIVLRVVALIPILLIATLHYFRLVCTLIYNYLKYGGETTVYNKKTNRTTILDVYDKLNSQFANQ